MQLPKERRSSGYLGCKIIILYEWKWAAVQQEFKPRSRLRSITECLAISGFRKKKT